MTRTYRVHMRHASGRPAVAVLEARDEIDARAKAVRKYQEKTVERVEEVVR